VGLCEKKPHRQENGGEQCNIFCPVGASFWHINWFKSGCGLLLQEAIRILNRFGYKKLTSDFLIMAENFRPENCFVIQVNFCKDIMIKLLHYL